MGEHTLVQAFQPQKYIKLIISLIGAAASTGVAFGLTGGSLSVAEMVNIAIAVVAAFQVWYVTETHDNPHGKAVIAGVATVLVAAQSVLASGTSLSLAEWLQIAVAAVTATGIVSTKTTKALLALPRSYANNTYVVNVGTPGAKTETRPVTVELENAIRSAHFMGPDTPEPTK